MIKFMLKRCIIVFTLLFMVGCGGETTQKLDTNTGISQESKNQKVNNKWFDDTETKISVQNDEGTGYPHGNMGEYQRFICSDAEWLYVVQNKSDGSCRLIRLRKDGTDKRCIYENKRGKIFCLNAKNNWLVFQLSEGGKDNIKSRKESICKIKSNGSDCLWEDSVYYLNEDEHGENQLCRMEINGGKEIVIADEVRKYCISGKWIYFVRDYAESTKLYKVNEETKELVLVKEGKPIANGQFDVIIDDMIYFESDDKELTRINCGDGKEEQISIESVSEDETKQPEWLDEKILAQTSTDWSKSIDENKQFIFILTIENKILKVDKETRKSTVIINNENEPGEVSCLEATEENLYYQVGDTEIYQYNLANEKITKIFESERDVVEDLLFGMKIYNNNMYLFMCGLVACEFDLKTKEKTELVENVSSAVFYDNKLFFIKRREHEHIYCMNLENKKIEIVRELKDKKGYRSLFTYGNNLCYNLQGEIYAYSSNGQDKLLISLKENQEWNLCDSYPDVYSYDKDTLYYVYDEDDNSYLCSYTGKKGDRDIKLQLPEDYIRNGCVCSGYFFYQAFMEDEEGEYDLEYYKYIFIE